MKGVIEMENDPSILAAVVSELSEEHSQSGAAASDVRMRAQLYGTIFYFIYTR